MIKRTHREAIDADLAACASRYESGMSLRERRSLDLRVRRLYAERDALTAIEAERAA
jgi:hypothetical protein